ncbi:LOW QUALITY PROTEIN: hypothetical protein PHMEG_0005401 [Phytophthora megakarya]|uniref:MULE transposase domain-containing protein n=1 Tax=Phytophthora megakarya TaxID=4795 RepID=A0A225WRJ3_9STRA|nr:LOW QUALITY PROTEIN: hypothetical protein PHMEG_0005401 [Phytophthora megakarya]
MLLGDLVEGTRKRQLRLRLRVKLMRMISIGLATEAMRILSLLESARKQLLRRADRDPASFIFHVDATYKLTQVGYPVIVVGLSDRARRFHLLGIFIVSQQKEEQHTEVLVSLRNIFAVITVLRVRYVMGDADAAQWNAVDSVFGLDCEYTFLMCYFHVAKKVFEKTRSLIQARASQVMEDIHDLHFTPDEEAFHSKLVEVQERWAKSNELSEFSMYFSKVWLNEQCFYTPTGFATTNNPYETYNAAIKRDVTLRRKLKVGALIPQLLTLCRSEGVTARPFATVCEPDARLVRRVRAMVRTNLLSVDTSSRCSIAFLLSDFTPDQPYIVRVVSRQSPGAFDETRHRTLEDLPISSQLNKLTANMDTRGMPTTGWAVSCRTR